MKQSITSFSFTYLLAAVAITALSACSTKHYGPTSPVVHKHSSEVVRTDRPSANPQIAQATEEVKVTTTVDKQLILSQEFFYGADLQYSSFYEKGMDLYAQSLAVGHIPAKFAIVGDELQLIADESRLYPSAVNHPARLISRYRILARTDRTLTLSGADSRVFLASVFGHLSSGEEDGAVTDPKAKPPRDLWIRSFDFVPNGNYLLQQTSVVLDDGTVAEFMESVFPRQNIAPGAEFQAFELDPENPAGAEEGMAARFRFLKGETLFKGERKYTMAQHFDISKTAFNPEGTIDWYVTRNVTDSEMAPIQLAVEGWNRYFKKLKGIERAVVRFKGRLPEGIYLGDPRYNVINWDNRLVAGAAYESQAVDPFTGKQSHSVIYMPAAWLQIGLDYWKKGQYSEPPLESVSSTSLARTGGIFGSARLACARDLNAAAALLASGRIAAQESSASKDPVKEFGTQLLKGTLFHEVGHALGMAHNFKGSLAFDRSSVKPVFSTSIMDYNDYEVEHGVFESVDSADGPELAYDRQILSALYNRGVDLAGEPVLPACNDDEADAEEEGVDPLCIRYDLEKDPTLSIGTAINRVEQATLAGDVTMAEALVRVPGIVLTSEALEAVKTEAQLQELVSKLAANLKGSMHFYLVLGKVSLARAVRTNVKSLLAFKADILKDGYKEPYDELGMRERAFRGVLKALTLKTLPQAMTAAGEQAQKAALVALAKTPYLQGLPLTDRSKATDEITKTLSKAILSVESDTANGLPKVRALVLAALARKPKVPFYFSKVDGGGSLDFETGLSGMLAQFALAKDGAANATKAERLAAVTALVSYRDRPEGDRQIALVRAGLLEARAIATDNASRELVETLLQALKPASGKNDE